jgi:nicotinamidase-related amidase
LLASPPHRQRIFEGKNTMTAALVIVDIQNDYFPGGAMALEGAEVAAENAARLLTHWRAKAAPVVHIQHLSVRPGASFFIPDTPGAEIHACVAPRREEAVLTKNFPNSFRGTQLLEILRAADADQIVFAGMMTHMCIDATVRAAFDYGFKNILAHDACATRAQTFGGITVPAAQVHAAFVSALHGLFAQARATSDILGEV